MKKTKRFSDTTQSKLNERAMARLISAQRCTKVNDGEHTVLCFGPDINGLDYSRKWLYEEELTHGVDTEQARINANKLVLYVNQKELAETADQIYKELFQKAEQNLRSQKGNDFSQADVEVAVGQMLY